MAETERLFKKEFALMAKGLLSEEESEKVMNNYHKTQKARIRAALLEQDPSKAQEIGAFFLAFQEEFKEQIGEFDLLQFLTFKKEVCDF